MTSYCRRRHFKKWHGFTDRPYRTRKRQQYQSLHLEPLEDRHLLSVQPFPIPLESVMPEGSLIYRNSTVATIDTPADVASFTIDVDDGQTITVIVDPDAMLQPTVELLDPSGTSLEIVSSAGMGLETLIQTALATAPGTYTIRVTGSGTTGPFALDLLLNSATAIRAQGEPSNDTAVTALDLAASFIPLADGSWRGAVLGKVSSDGIIVQREDFESGTLGGQWTTFSSHPLGRIEVTGSQKTAGGNFALLMDVSSKEIPNLNEAIWTVDLSAVGIEPNEEVTLRFSHVDFHDEQTLLPDNFTGSVEGDGVAISDDGIRWHTVLNATDIPTRDWQPVVIDLTSEAASAGMTLGANFQIKFQQFDNFPRITDGRGYDEITLSVPSIPEDWYQFELADGQSASLAVTALEGDVANLQLIDSDGTTLLAEGVAAANVDWTIRNFVDQTTDSAANTYYVRILGKDTPYSLVVTTDADFDTEENHDFLAARDISGSGSALGHVAAGEGVSDAVASGSPILNFDGQRFNNVQPPDTVGDVGSDYYIQAINHPDGTTFTIYNKSDGSVAMGPTILDTLAPAETPGANGFGDPIVLYDHLANRWLITEFSGTANGLSVYVSQTSDPTENLWYHQFFNTAEFPDYPKIAVWPDGYYVTSNESTPAVYILDRENLLLGNTPRPIQRFAAPVLAGFEFQSLTPADLDGPEPPDGTPALFMRQRDDEVHNASNNPSQDFLEIWSLDSDLDDGANSVFTQIATVPISEFDSDLCGLISFECFPQPGTTVGLDPLREVVMNRLQYRNFGSYESLVGNFVTDVDGSDHGGVRWFELRNSGNGWTLYQEGTVAPDADNRWLGSIAMDGAGNIALGYNVGSANLSAGLNYTGRLAGDPLGTMPLGEYVLVQGEGNNSSNRWGDYSAMVVDPVDDRTFWFTGEYADNGQWGTRIGSFQFAAAADDDWYQFSVNSGDDLSIDSWLPGNGPFEFANPLSEGLAGGVILSEVVDGTLADGNPKFVEITNTTATPFTFSAGGLIVQTGNSTDRNIDIDLSGITLAGSQSFVIASAANEGRAVFESTYGFAADLYTEELLGDGNDRYLLTDSADGSRVLDMYGQLDTNGTGSSWEYTDSYAFRRPIAIGPTGTDFLEDEWFLAGVDALQTGDDATELPLLRSLTSPGTHLSLVEGEPLLRLELYDPAGSLVELAGSSVRHTALLDGNYRARVLALAEAGEYFFSVDGATGPNASPRVISSNPGEETALPIFPTTYTLTFSESLLAPSIGEEDFRVGGLPALSVTRIDGETYRFQVDPAANLGDGVYTVELLADSVIDLQGQKNDAYTTTFAFDSTPPVILRTALNQNPLPADRVLPAGSLSFEAFLSESVRTNFRAGRGLRTPGTEDVVLVNNLTGQTFHPNSTDFDLDANRFRADFDPLTEGFYTLTLLSGDLAFEDLVGNDLDGEPLGANIDGTPTGDRFAGGDYHLDFSLDNVTPATVEPLQRFRPVGSLVLGSEGNRGLFNKVGDVDSFTIPVQAGQTLAAILRPNDPRATVSIELAGLAAPIVAAAPGLSVILPPVQISDSGLVNLLVELVGQNGEVEGTAISTFTLDVLWNTAIEALVGDTDDGNELLLDDSWIDLGAGRLAVIGSSNPLIIPVGAGRLYATPNDGTNDIVELDPADGIEIGRFAAPEPLSSAANGLAFDGTSLFFISGEGSRTLYELDPDTGSVLDADLIAADFGRFDALASLPGRLFITDYVMGDVLEFDPVTDTITNTWDVNKLNPGVQLLGGLSGITDPDALIATTAYGDIVEINSETGRVDNTFMSVAGTLDAGVAVLGGEIYVGALRGGQEINVYRRDGTFVREFALPYAVTGLGGDDFVDDGSGPAGDLLLEPNDILSAAVPSGIGQLGGTFLGSGQVGDNPNLSSSPGKDVDLIEIQLRAGDRATIDIDAIQIGSTLDPVLTLFHSSGQIAAQNDDAGSLDSFIDFTATLDDTFYVGVSGYNNLSYNPFLEGSGSEGSTGVYDLTINVTTDQPEVIMADVDEYELDLTGLAGQRIDIILASHDGSHLSGRLLQILDRDGSTVLATATPAPMGGLSTNYDLAILDWLVPDGPVPNDGTYTLRLHSKNSRNSADYTLLVTQGMLFDSEPNDRPSDRLRNLDTNTSALGFLGSALGGNSRLFGIDSSHSEVVEWAPANGQELNRWSLPDIATGGPDALAFDGTSLFYASAPAFGGNGILYELAPNTGVVLDSDAFASVGLSAGIDGLGAFGGRIIASDAISSELFFVDPATDLVTGSVILDVTPLGGAAGAGTRGTVFVSDVLSGMIYEIDPASGTVLNSLAAPSGSILGLAFVNGSLFTGDVSTGQIIELDPDHGTVLNSFDTGLPLSALGGDDATGTAPFFAAAKITIPNTSGKIPVVDYQTLAAPQETNALDTKSSSWNRPANDVARFYIPPQQYRFDTNQFLTGPSDQAPADIAVDYLRSLAQSDFSSTSGFTVADLEDLMITGQTVTSNTGVTHVYLRQTYQGLEILNADANVNIAADGSVISAGMSFVSGLDPLAEFHEASSRTGSVPMLTPDDALASLADYFGWSLDVRPAIQGDGMTREHPPLLAPRGVSLAPIPVEMQYVPTPDGDIELAWQLIVQTIDGAHWYDASVGVNSGKVLYWADWVDDATYQVFPLPLESPLHGERTVVTDPYDQAASPWGWQDTNGQPGAEFTDTRGNNVFSQEDRDDNNTGGFRPSGTEDLNFEFPIDFRQSPRSYESAVITNLFYWNNILHDLHYQYGFDEIAGNFQQTNYSGNGLGGDAVRADAQDGSGTDNANFASPPDGQAPRMQQFVFTQTSPNRDSGLDSGIIIHEYGHGVSNRLTGGPANAGALDAIQSGGMGEGWSDWWALMFTQEIADTATDAYPIGTYVLGQNPVTGTGFRRFPYSFDTVVDPLTYGNYNSSNEMHDAGEIWASALWDLNWLLIEGNTLDPSLPPGLGFDPDLMAGTGGNNLALRLVTDALKLQPSNPSFLDGRDAILTADQVLTGGVNSTAIWTAFARRGMGFSASDGSSGNATTVVEAFDLPATRQGTISLDQEFYEVGNEVAVRLQDLDLTGTGPIRLLVTATGGDSETVTLTESATANGVFSGSILTANLGIPEDGTLDVSAGHRIRVAYDDLDDGTGNPVSVSAEATILQFIDVLVADFSDPAGNPDSEGFTISGPSNQWHLSTGRGDDPGHSAQNSFYFGSGETSGGGGQYSNNANGTLTSPTLDLTPYLKARLTFDYFLETETNYDFAVVQVLDESGATLIGQSQVQLPVATGGFNEVSFNLTPFVGQEIQLTFQFVSDDSVTFEGWYVDDVAVHGGITDLALVGPRAVNITPAAGPSEDLGISSLFLEFNEPITDSSANDAANYQLLEAGPNGLFEGGSGDDLLIPVSPLFDGDRKVELVLDGNASPLDLGTYQLTLDGDSSIEDLDGNPLGSITGPGGGKDVVHTFEVVFNFPAGGDIYQINLDRGRNVTILAQALFADADSIQPNGLDPEVIVYGPNGLPLASDQDSLDGKNAMVSFRTDTTGTHLVQVRAQSGVGEYLLDVDIQDSADFDIDNDIDGLDFLAWQRGFGITGGASRSHGDADHDGDVDRQDLAVWESSFGTLLTSPSTTTQAADRDVDGLDFLAWQQDASLTEEVDMADQDSVRQNLANWRNRFDVVSSTSDFGATRSHTTTGIATGIATGITAEAQAYPTTQEFGRAFSSLFSTVDFPSVGTMPVAVEHSRRVPPPMAAVDWAMPRPLFQVLDREAGQEEGFEFSWTLRDENRTTNINRLALDSAFAQWGLP